MDGIDSTLIAGRLGARSVARGLPPPVAEHGGWRVDTGSPQQLRRYVFAEATDGLRRRTCLPHATAWIPG